MSKRAVRWTLSLGAAASVALLGAWAAAPASAGTGDLPMPQVTPGSVLAGSSVTVTGTNCDEGVGLGAPQGVDVVLLNGGLTIAAKGVAPSAIIDGNWTATLTVPVDTSPGTYTIASTCDKYYGSLGKRPQNYQPAQLIVTAPVLPGVQLSPSTVQVGGSFDITGENFVPNESVTAELHSTPVTLGTTTAKSDGTVTMTATVPAGTALGQHDVQLLGTAGDSASAVLTVIAASAAPATHTQLAATGTNSNLTFEGLILLVIGLATITFAWQWAIASERAAASRRKQLTYRPTPNIRWDY